VCYTGSKQNLSLRDLPDDMWQKLAASQRAAAEASGSNNSEQSLRRQPLAKKLAPVVAERSFSF